MSTKTHISAEINRHVCIWLGVVTSGHVTKMAVTPFNPPYPKTACCTQIHGLTFYRTLPMEVLYCVNRDFRPFLFLWHRRWPDDLHIRTSPIFPGDIPDMRKWTSYVNAVESYRMTERQTDRQTGTTTIRKVFRIGTVCYNWAFTGLQHSALYRFGRFAQNYIPCHFAGGQK